MSTKDSEGKETEYELCCYGTYVSENSRCKTCSDQAWCEVDKKYNERSNEENGKKDK